MQTRPLSLSLTLALAALLAAPLLAADPPKGSPEQRQAITDIRNVGTAMFQWYRDTMVPRASGATSTSADEPHQVDLAAVPVLSAEELSRVLVPKYIPQIPEKDPWGHPYEYRLNTTDPDARHVMALRSTGRDGAAAGTVYPIGSFPPADEDQDVVWMDGYFARWPEAPKAGR